MKRKSLISLLTAIAVIFSMIPLSVSAEPAQKPRIDIVGATIKGDKEYFELSMKVTPADAGYYTAGVVLKYNSDIIKPAVWGKEAKTVPMDSTSDWQHVAALPAVCPAELSGKTALAYEPTPEPAAEANYGYISLISEAPLTVKEGSAPFIAASPEPAEYGRTMTVRFKYVGSTAEEIANSKKAVEDNFANETIVSLAPEDISVLSPVGETAVYQADEQLETSCYYYSAAADTTGKIGTAMQKPSFTLLTDADTANSGGGSASDFAPIVFFDWDGETLLGSMVVGKGADATADVKAFADTLKDPAVDNVTTFYSADKKYPMTNKKGYSFEDVWIDFNSEERTHYGAVVSGDPIPKPTGISFTNVQDDMLVKAVYGSNSEIATGDMNYTTEIKEYGRFGTTTNYSVTIKVKRENTEGDGVPRTGESAVRVVLTTTGNAKINLLYSIDNIDETSVQIATNTQISSVQANVIDTYGTDNWVGTATRSANEMSYSMKTVVGEKTIPGFIAEGTAAYICSLTEEWVAGGKAPTYPLVFVSNKTTGMGITTTGTTIAKIRPAIKTAWMEKNGLNTEADYDPTAEYVGLTSEEIGQVVYDLRFPS